ncbi:S-adenosyl-L-methionine-dependent methyltransferase [Corynespora cassiicola Philippines]|uniref:S-adenosyl-L-methionine-dependent methyltransferase n=1 Tax=Corynespora cassiicola Philippines TaxID=1448308 RepID=A0A2T2NI10_CORCC|nr:S-adenosyl-L-methionine-dependent methyltransferase [Corynespora cassiicola Philippines]
MSATGADAAAGGGASTAEDEARVSTQNTQYDAIGTRYNAMHELPSVEPERPSVIAALGDIRGKRCLDLACGTGRYTALLSSLGAESVHGYDISPVMIAGAQAAYPPSSHPTLHFSVADCSNVSNLPAPPPGGFDAVFAGWFLNYAGSEHELTSMFRVVERNLAPSGGRFVGITTNVHDDLMREPKDSFYGINVEVLDRGYRDPTSGEELGIKARVRAETEPPVQFDVFQFEKEVYERCAERAGLKVGWRGIVLPDDGRKETGYWERYLERPTFVVIEAERL